MTDSNIPASFDHIHQVVGCFLGCFILVFNRLMLFGFDQ